jgi:hypothetical protein
MLRSIALDVSGALEVAGLSVVNHFGISTLVAMQ